MFDVKNYWTPAVNRQPGFRREWLVELWSKTQRTPNKNKRKKEKRKEKKTKNEKTHKPTRERTKEWAVERTKERRNEGTKERRNEGTKAQVSGLRSQVSGLRSQVLGLRSQVSGDLRPDTEFECWDSIGRWLLKSKIENRIITTFYKKNIMP